MAHVESTRRVHAVVDPNLEVIVQGLTPLVYARGASAEADVPDHVRAASSVRRSRARLVIVQDDVNVLALHDAAGRTAAVLLPVGERGRRTFDEESGNKHAKMDLEACALLPDGRLVAFGSGSTEARERLVVVRDTDPRVVEGRNLYAALRAEAAFAGSELNIEGALVVGDRLRLFQRGNGKPMDGLSPVNATCDVTLSGFLAWLDGGARLPPLQNIVQYDLGQIFDVPFTFTDAARMAGGRIAFVACAEASPDTVRDGAVLGCRFGIMDGDGVSVADVRHPDGGFALLKLEGIEPRPGTAGTFDVVADMDRTDEPALLGRLELRWRGTIGNGRAQVGSP